MQGRDRVVPVQGREDEVSREGGLHGDAGGLDVTDLADEDHVGVLAQNRLQPGREGQARLLVGLDLVDLGEVNSTGSSIVMTLRERSLTSESVAYRVVVLPLPVGPAHNTMPKGARTSLEYVSWVSTGMPRSLRRSTERFLSRIRMTHFSPQMVATVATRTSVSFPSMVS